MAPRKSRSATINTVARDAGVSVSAVSKVLRGAYGVSANLRAKVEASIRKLDYRPSNPARSLRGWQTHTLGILLPDLRNPFIADAVAGITDALERTPYQALMGLGKYDSAFEHGMVDAMVERHVDGILLIGPRTTETDLDAIAKRIPIVVIGHHLPGVTSFDTINCDDHLGGELAVRHLYERGYRSIACMTLDQPPPNDSVSATHRARGYRAAMEKLGAARQVQIVVVPMSPREIRAGARELLRGSTRPDAIFCWTDYVAFEVLSVARDLGLDVPKDLAVVGYDNTPYCDLSQNALTSIDQSAQILGLQAARLLTERITGRTEAEHLVVTPRLVGRESTARRASRG